MTRTLLLLLVSVLAGCAHLRPDPRVEAREDAWREAHFAFYRGDYPRATAEFEALATAHPETGEGREALFFLAVLSLDPRNPAWNPQPAAERLRRYLQLLDSVAPSRSFPRPEARTLLELADQLNLPPQDRVAGLQADTRVVQVPTTRVERVVVPAAESRALAAEVERLRREMEARDTVIRRQREELERIRSTLAPRRP
jgi:hypothetical protein